MGFTNIVQAKQNTLRLGSGPLEPRFQLPASELLQEQGVPIQLLSIAQGPAPELWGEMWLESDLRM